MAASMTDDSDRDPTDAMPSLTAATPSPTTTPSRTKPSPFKSPAKSRRKRLSPAEESPDQDKTKSDSGATTTASDLFGDYMSIEEIAAQTEKAYQNRKSPMRTTSIRAVSSSVSPRRSPRRIMKKKSSDGSSVASAGSIGSSRSSTKKTKDGITQKTKSMEKTLLVLFLVTIVLPFLLCEGLLLLLTLRYSGDHTIAQGSMGTIDTESMMTDLSSVYTEQSENIQADSNDFSNDGEVIDRNQNESFSEKQFSSSQEHSDVTHVPTNNDKISKENPSEKSIEKEAKVSEEELLDEPTPANVEEVSVDNSKELETNALPEEIEATKDDREPRDDDTPQYQMMLNEAFSLISAARSITVTETQLEQIGAAETLCRQVMSHAKQMTSVLKNGAEDKTESSTDSNNFVLGADALESYYFQSNLCIGGVKMSMTVTNADTMLQEAKQLFEHLVSHT